MCRYESAEMYWHLFDAGVPVKHLVYNKVGHGDFVVQWPLNLYTASAAAGGGDWGHNHGAADDWGAGLASAAATAVADAAGTAAAVVSGNAAGAAAGTEAVGLGREDEAEEERCSRPSDGNAQATRVYELSRSTHKINRSSSISGIVNSSALQESWSGDPQALSAGAGAAAGASLLESNGGSVVCSTEEFKDGQASVARQTHTSAKEGMPRSVRAKQQEDLLKILPLHNQDIAKLVGGSVMPKFAVRGKSSSD
jgi:hypothetical protein